MGTVNSVGYTDGTDDDASMTITLNYSCSITKFRSATGKIYINIPAGIFCFKNSNISNARYVLYTGLTKTATSS